jgi:hypothetical protein
MAIALESSTNLIVVTVCDNLLAAKQFLHFSELLVDSIAHPP